MTEEEMLAQLKEKNAQRATKPRAGETDYRDNNLMAGARAAFRSGTAGFGEKITAGVKAPFSDKTYQELKQEEFARSEQISRQNPVADLIGEIGGSFLPTGLAIKGVEKVASALPWAAKGLAKTDTVAGRTLKSLGAGGAEGAVYALGQDQPVAEGVLWGAGAGAIGQATLGEAFPAMWRGLGGKPGSNQAAKTEYKAKEEIKNILRMKYGNDMPDDEIIDKLHKRIDELGPDATLADLDSSLYKYGLKGLQSGAHGETVENWTKKFIARAELDREGFTNTMNKISNGESVMTPQQIKEAVGKDTKAYQPEFEKALNRSTLQMDPKTLQQMLDAAFDEDKVALGSVKAAKNKLSNSIKDLVSQVAKRDGIKKKDVVLSAKDLQKLKGQIDEMYNKAVNPMSKSFSKGRARDLAGMRTAIDNAIAETSEGYKKVNNKYRSTFDVSNAYDMGRDFMKNKSDPTDYDTFLHTAGPAQFEAFMEGAKYHLVKQLNAAGGEGKLQKQIDASNDMRAKLHQVLPREVADELIRGAQEIAKFGKKGDEVTKAVDDAVTTPRTGNTGDLVDIGIAAGALLDPRVSKAAGLGAGRRLATSVQGDRPRIDQDIMELLTTEGPEAVMRLFEGAPSGLAASDAAAAAGAGAAITQQGQNEGDSNIPFR